MVWVVIINYMRGPPHLVEHKTVAVATLVA